MLDVLARLRVKGFGLCVEGVGHHGLARYPLTRIALPSELITSACESGDTTALHPAIDASLELGVPLIGRCETGDEFELLLRLGCSFAHGPFMARAITESHDSGTWPVLVGAVAGTASTR